MFSFVGYSQKRELDSLPKNLEEYIIVKPGDTLTIEFDEISIFPKQKFKSTEDIRYYLWFKSKVFKVYPYARLASQRLDTLNNRLERIKSNSKKRKYVKLIQEYMEGEFTDQLKKMTNTEGRILIKLIHRQTGKTTFDNIKEFRSGWKAFWYNTTASLFKLSLKEEYHPESVNEDFLIEDILQRAFQNDYLQYQPSKLKVDFANIIADKKAEINVEEYKKMFAKMKKRK
jgi:hypothetical protein